MAARTSLKEVSGDADIGLKAIAALEKKLNADGQLPAALHSQTRALVEMIEASLS